MYYDENMNIIEDPDLSACTISMEVIDGKDAFVLHPITGDDLERRKEAQERMRAESFASKSQLDELACAMYEMVKSANPLVRIDVPDAVAKAYARMVDRNEAELSSLPKIVQERISEIKEKAWS